MTIKITTPNGGSDSLDFGCAQTPNVAAVTGTEVSSGEGKLELKTTTGGTSATKATILANGNVGIGVTAPYDPLTVAGDVRIKASGGRLTYFNSDAAYSLGSSGGCAVRFVETAGSQEIAFETHYSGNSHAERMRIDKSGNVGIGVTNPDLKMEIVDTSSGASKDALLLTNYGAASNTETGIFFSPTEADGAIRGARISALNDGANDSNSVALKFSTGLGAPPVERMRITSAGNVGIGSAETSLFNGAGTSAKLVVTGSNSNTNIVQNGVAAIAIVNTDQTDENTAGLHFARADTDDTPNYAGASIVAQFKETQATGQYPSATLNFLTSNQQNHAPSLKMTLDNVGRLTTPFQAGVGSYTSAQRTSNGQMINYSGATGNFNVGGHFNASTGVFTAPIAGRYLVAVTGKSDHNGVGRGLFRLFINGGQYDEIVETYGSYQDVGSAQIINLSASDYLHVTIEGATGSAPYRCSFNAMLLA